MPNWVFNKLEITGDDEKLEKLSGILSAPYKGEDNGLINFLNLIAPPDDKWKIYYTDWLGSGTETERSPWNWYEWNLDNWGTKWNANGSEVMNGDRFICLSFNTAWSPPGPVIDALSTLAFELGIENISYTWEEEQGFGEDACWEPLRGWQIVEQWEIPTTHAEMELRGECHCSIWEEKVFDDCPKLLSEVGA